MNNEERVLGSRLDTKPSVSIVELWNIWRHQYKLEVLQVDLSLRRALYSIDRTSGMSSVIHSY